MTNNDRYQQLFRYHNDLTPSMQAMDILGWLLVPISVFEINYPTGPHISLTGHLTRHTFGDPLDRQQVFFRP